MPMLELTSLQCAMLRSAIDAALAMDEWLCERESSDELAYPGAVFSGRTRRALADLRALMQEMAPA